MILIYDLWRDFCSALHDNQIQSVTARDVLNQKVKTPYLVLKHDVETNVASALRMAKIELEYGHYGSYYVQADLLNDAQNLQMLREIQSMGNEVSYHYDVMDSAKGDMKRAEMEYKENAKKFADNGFSIDTVCQHGNPIVERVNYASNRDFFRSRHIQDLYSNVADIMVNFKEKAATDYLYFSDAGRQFKLIFDPINNDIIPSDERNENIDRIDKLLAYAMVENVIVSTHPHRWMSSALQYQLHGFAFKGVKAVAKKLAKIPLMKKIMNRYYYLAKQI